MEDVKLLKYIFITDRGNFEAEGLNVNEAREKIEALHKGGLMINESLTEAQARKRKVRVSVG